MRRTARPSRSGGARPPVDGPCHRVSPDRKRPVRGRIHTTAEPRDAPSSAARRGRREGSRMAAETRSRPRVFATRALPGGGLERLGREAEVELWPGPGAPPREALLAGAARADGLLCLLTDRVDAELLARAPRLRVVSSCSVGLDHVDLAAATARRIPVGHTP